MPNEGNPRLILRLDPLIRSDLQARAMSRGVSLNELAKFVLVEYVKQSAQAKEGAPALFRHLDTLVRTLQLQATEPAKGPVRNNTGVYWQDLAWILAGELDRPADGALAPCICRDYEDCKHGH